MKAPGFLTRENLLQLLARADLFVHCSEVELEGLAILEAMSLGLPVLVADNAESAASTFALDERFRFAGGDAGDLARKLDALIERPDVLAAASKSYRALAAQFDFKTSVDDVVRIYRQVVAEPRSSR